MGAMAPSAKPQLSTPPAGAAEDPAASLLAGLRTSPARLPCDCPIPADANKAMAPVKGSALAET